MATTRPRRGRFQGDVKGSEICCFPIVRLQQLRRDVGDDPLFLKSLRRNFDTFRGDGPATFGPFDRLNEVTARGKRCNEGGIKRRLVSRQAVQERGTGLDDCGDVIGCLRVEDAALYGHPKLFQQPYAGSGFVAFKGLLKALHGWL